MTKELSPIELVQNPAFGSVLLWSYGRAYQVENPSELPSAISFFLILPLILHGPTLLEIKSTYPTSGLSKLIAKLAENRERLFAVHERALIMRTLTLQSLAAGISTKLLSLEYETALVRSNDAKPPTPPERLKHHVAGAGKLGKWFARLPDAQIFSLLQVSP